MHFADTVGEVTNMIKTYSELITLPTFKERFEYLCLGGTVGKDTFGFERYLNQKFYKSAEWQSIRREVIVRDNGCDLGVDGYDIHGKIIIHHMNPICVEDITKRSGLLLNPEYLITTVLATHNAIHYGDVGMLPTLPQERSRNDTCPWKH